MLRNELLTIGIMECWNTVMLGYGPPAQRVHDTEIKWKVGLL
jgi:hypothetical protein